MAITQSSELIRFISNIPVSSDGAIPINRADDEPAFESELYIPTYYLSVLARLTQDILNSDKIETVNIPVDSSTLTYKVLNSDLSTYASDIYLLIRATVLESFSLVYHIEEDKQSLQYVTSKDIQRIKANINYIADYMSTVDRYYHIIEYLRDMNVSLGYIEYQIDVIMNSRGVRR